MVGALKDNALRKAQFKLFGIVQRQYFSAEMKQIEESAGVSSQSKLRDLNAFMIPLT